MTTILQQAEANANEDRLRLVAERIYADRKVPDQVLCESITRVVTDSEWMRDILTSSLSRPLIDIFFGCILFGWKLCEEYYRLKDSSQTIYRS